MQLLPDDQRSDAGLKQREQFLVAQGAGVERRYKHLSKLDDCTKLRHNEWVLRSARAHQAHCLVLDGVNMFTSKNLINGGVPACRVHVPNKADYDAIVAAPRSPHGNIYRCSVLKWAQALVALSPIGAPDASLIFSSCAATSNDIKTIWLDFTCRWSAHVEHALTLLLRPTVMGAGSSDLFLTLNADSRCPSALRADGAQRFIADAVARAGGSVDFPADRCEEYGNGMFILQAAVRWCDGCSSTGAALYERLRREAHAFRKEENSLQAKAE